VDTRRRLAGGSSSWGATVSWMGSGRENR
jgi:hypothetical protein